jgi:hypothetical protein
LFVIVLITSAKHVSLAAFGNPVKVTPPKREQPSKRERPEAPAAAAIAVKEETSDNIKLENLDSRKAERERLARGKSRAARMQIDFHKNLPTGSRHFAEEPLEGFPRNSRNKRRGCVSIVVRRCFLFFGWLIVVVFNGNCNKLSFMPVVE